MHPVLLSLGPLTIYSYGVMLALGAGLGLVLLGRLARSQGLDAERVQSLALWVLIAALAGSRLVFVALEPAGFIAQPWRVFFIWEGGLVFYGGVAAGLITGVILARCWRLGLWPLLDSFAPALTLGQALGRVGCFLAGCCYGLPWEGGFCAVTFTAPGTLAPPGMELHPTQLYSAGALGVILLAELGLWRRWAGSGRVFMAYGLMHGLARVIIERLRGDWRGEELFLGFTPTALFALALAAASAAGLVWLSRGSNAREA